MSAPNFVYEVLGIHIKGVRSEIFENPCSMICHKYLESLFMA